MNAKELGRRIRSARKEHGLTQEMLGEKAGVDHSQISRIEHGQNVRVSANVQKLCDFLQIAVRAEGASAVLEDVGLKVKLLIQEWPQSEQLICDILDSLRQAYEARSPEAAR